MKKIVFISIVIFIFCPILNCTAQMGGMQNGGGMGGGMMGGGGMNGGGMNRGMGNQSMNIPQSERKVEKIDVLQSTLDRLEKDLTLDTFQKAVIKQVFQEGEFTMKSVIDSKISEEMKELKISEIRANTDKRIAKVLNKEQNEKYEKLKEKAKKRQ